MRGKHPNYDTASGGAAPVEDAVRVCQRCNMMLDHEFTMVRGRPACPYCTDILKSEKAGSPAAQVKSATPAVESQDASESGGPALALAYGFAAMLFAGTAYAAVVIATQFEIGFMAAGVGWATGTAVRRGNGAAAGTGLRLAGVVFTYLALAMAYAGICVHAVYNSTDGNAAAYRELLDQALHRLGDGAATAPIEAVLAAILTPTLIFPLTGGFFGLVFLAIGVYQAWRVSGKRNPNEDFEAVRARVG